MLRVVAPCIDHFRPVEELPTPTGSKEKDLLVDPSTGRWYVAKLGGRDNDVEVVSEYLISIVGRALGARVADAAIGYYRGRLRFLSRYFLDLKKAEELVHGMQLFEQLYSGEELASIAKNDLLEQRMFRVDEVRAAFAVHYPDHGTQLEKELFRDFVLMLTHDAIIGVNDRHAENWGVIVTGRAAGAAPPRFAPLYDSAAGLLSVFREQDLRKKFAAPNVSGTTRRARVERYIRGARPLVGCVDQQDQKVDHVELLGNVYRCYPEAREPIQAMLGRYNPRRIEQEIRLHLGPLCSGLRRDLILQCLAGRVRALRAKIQEIK